jgi:hypothetical protein
MYIRNPDAAAKAYQRGPDIDTLGEKILFNSRSFLSDSEMSVSGYTVQRDY